MKLSRRKIEDFSKCPRCFWLEVKHGIKPPKTLPLALNLAMDNLLKVHFDEHRQAGKLPPVLQGLGDGVRLFSDTALLKTWRSNRIGVNWTDPESGHILFGAIDDLVEFTDGSVAVVDFKASGANEAKVYDTYQLQLDTYTFLLQKLGYRTKPEAYLAYFLAVKDNGFDGQLPFKAELVRTPVQPDRVYGLFLEAVKMASSDQAPETGEECDRCRWLGEAVEVSV